MASSSTPDTVIAASGPTINLMLPRTGPHPGLRPVIRHFAGLPPLTGPVWRPSWAA
ncbi:hypothetical protein ACFYON_22370 [Micromonospora sp. NPDC005686]|uniref:hypothetical protein n=1 Tax=unclassified Micromonospora TaxID=2617518 RepID=UPI0036CB0339